MKPAPTPSMILPVNAVKLNATLYVKFKMTKKGIVLTNHQHS